MIDMYNVIGQLMYMYVTRVTLYKAAIIILSASLSYKLNVMMNDVRLVRLYVLQRYSRAS